jgi:exodeoxyribonuclease VIII
MKHVMLDLETMGNGNRAAIVAIGACEFDPAGASRGSGNPDTPITNKFYCQVALQSSMGAGLDIDVSTILWWMQQSDAARKSTFCGDNTQLLPTALLKFREWLQSLMSISEVSRASGFDVAVWGNGATFDNVIIRSAYKACGLRCPWSFRTDKCYRTVKNLAPQVPFEKYGTAHNALDDAIAQALHLQKVWKALGL